MKRKDAEEDAEEDGEEDEEDEEEEEEVEEEEEEGDEERRGIWWRKYIAGTRVTSGSFRPWHGVILLYRKAMMTVFRCWLARFKNTPAGHLLSASTIMVTRPL